MDGYTPLNLEQFKTALGVGDLNIMIEKLFRNAAGDGETVRVFSGFGTPEGVIAAGVGALYLRKDGGTGTSIYKKETGTLATGWVAIAQTTLDGKVKVSSNDTTPGFLNGKLIAGTGITFTEGSDGGNETLEIKQTSIPLTKVAEVSPSAVSSIIVSSSLSPAKRYKLFIDVRVAGTGAAANIAVRFNNISSASYAHSSSTNAAGTVVDSGGTGADRARLNASGAGSLEADAAFVGEYYINTDPSDSTRILISGHSCHGTNARGTISAGSLDTSSAFSRLDVLLSAGNMTGKIALYELS